MTLVPGQLLGSYEILSPLGAGGMGEVYVARDRRLDRKVALKTLPDRLVRDPAAFARFEREAKALAALNHPGILGIFDFGEQDGIVYAVAELLEGRTLREAMASGPVSPRRVAQLGAQAALALAAAHDRGIVHRDLKPENLFITADGLVKILDFGLARTELKPLGGSLAGTEAMDAPLTLEGSLVGTVGYMSPEQARGESAGPASDIFSLGVVLYELLAGTRPFRGGSGIEVLHAILSADPDPLSGSGRIPPALEQIVQHCLEKEAASRFQNARDLAFALGHVESAAAPLPGPARRGRGRLLAAGALAAVLVAGCAFLAGLSRPAPLPSFTPMTHGRGTISSARFVPGSKEVLYSASWNGEGERWYMRRIDQAGLRQLPGGEGPVLSVAAGGGAMGLAGAYLSHGQKVGRLFSLPPGGGDPREWADMVWAADQGERPGDFASAIGTYGGDTRLEWPLGTALLTSPQLLRHLRIHGDRLAVFRETQGNVVGGEILVLDRQGKVQVLGDLTGVTGLAWGPSGKEVWVSTFHLGQSRFLALDLHGGQRTLMQHAGRLELQDVAPDGTALAVLNAWQRHTYGRRAGEAVDRDLGWQDGQATMSLSGDGKRVLLANLGEWSTTEGPLFLRALDGTPPRMIEVEASMQPNLSMDGQWIAAMTREPVVTLNLLPTGPGVPRRMPIPEFKGNDLSMTPLPGGKRVLVWGSRSGAPLDFFIADLDTGQMKAIAQGGHAPFLFQSLIAPDGRTTVAISIPDSKGDHTTLEIMDLEGQRPVRRMDLGLREAVSGWTADSGGLLVWDRNRIPAVVERLDLASGRRTPVLKIMPQDPAGVSGVQGVFLANDGRTYVYNVVSRLSDLFLVQGLR